MKFKYKGVELEMSTEEFSIFMNTIGEAIRAVSKLPDSDSESDVEDSLKGTAEAVLIGFLEVEREKLKLQRELQEFNIRMQIEKDKEIKELKAYEEYQSFLRIQQQDQSTCRRNNTVPQYNRYTVFTHSSFRNSFSKKGTPSDSL